MKAISNELGNATHEEMETTFPLLGSVLSAHLLSVAFTHVATLRDRRVFGLVFLRLGHTSRVRGVPLTAKFHAAIDTREDVAPPALGFVLLHLILLTVRAATRALEEDHVRRK